MTMKHMCEKFVLKVIKNQMMHSFISQPFTVRLLLVRHFVRLSVPSNKRHPGAAGLVGALETQQGSQRPLEKCYDRGICRQLRMHAQVQA